MRIKDTSRFVNEILLNKPNERLNPLLGDTNPLLQSFLGNVKKTKEYIKSLGNFVSKSPNKQLIFEFLQNADDSNNDNPGHGSLGLYYNEDYLLVINNGKPFSMEANGDLRGFLSEGDGKAARGVEGVKGKFGKGSKLLYNLLLDDNDKLKNEEELRLEAIYEELRGPILYSWGANGSVSSIFNNDQISLADPLDDAYPLLTKIIHGYYPAYPGEVQTDKNGNEIELFPVRDVKELAAFLKTIEKDVFMDFRKRGSLIFIKLGKDRFKSIDNDQKFEMGIRTYISFSKNIKYVYFQNQRINKTNFESIGELSVKKEGKTFRYTISFPSTNEDIQQLDFVNFHDLLPIINESHGLKFIIDTSEFHQTPDRQSLKLEEALYVRERFNEIIDLIDAYLQNDSIPFEKRTLLYNAIIASNPHQKSETIEVIEFYDRLIDRISNYAPGENELMVDKDNLLSKRLNLDIDLSELEFDNKQWVHEICNPFVDELEGKIGVKPYDVLQLINEEDTVLTNWLKSITANEYEIFIDDLKNVLDNDRNIFSIYDRPIIKATDGEVYSWREFDEEFNFFLFSEPCPVKQALIQIGAIISNEETYPLVQYFSTSINNKFIEFLNENKLDILPDKKYLILDYLKKGIVNINELRNNLVIFRNRKGEFRPLSQLINKYKILDQSLISFVLINLKENHPVLKDLFMQENEVWDALLEQWNELEYKIESDEEFIDSLLTIYQSSSSKQYIGDLEMIPGSNGDLCSRNEMFLHIKLSKLSRDKYEILVSKFEALGMCFPNYDFIDDLSGAPFSSGPSSASEFQQAIQDNELTLSYDELLVFKKLVDDIEGSFLAYFTVSEDGGEYAISPNYEVKVYFSNDNSLNEFLQDKKGYALLPESLNILFNDDKDLFSQHDIIEDVIISYGAHPLLIDVVLKSTHDIKKLYINRIEELPLDSQNEYKRDSFEYKVLKLSADLEDQYIINYIRSVISIDGKELEEYGYEDGLIIKLENKKIYFELSKILQEYSGVTDAIDRVKKAFSFNGKNKIFSLKKMDNTEVLESLEDYDNLNEIQLAYVIINNMADEYTISAEELWDDSDEFNAELLNILYEKLYDKEEIQSFVDVYQFENLDFEIAILTSDTELLLDEEELPQWLLDWWMEGDQQKKEEFLKANGLYRHKRVLYFRKNYENESVKFFGNVSFIHNTLAWVSSKDEFLNREAKGNIKELINRYYGEYKELPEYVVVLKEHNDELNTSLEELADYSCYINDFTSFEDQLVKLKSNTDFEYQIIDNSFPKLDKEVFEEAEIPFLEIIPRLNKDKIHSSVEWDEEYYHKWRQTEQGEPYTIYFLEESVPQDNYAIVNNEEFYIDSSGTGNISSIKINDKTEIYISQSYLDEEDKHVLVALEENIRDLDMYGSHLLALNKFYIEHMEQLNNAVKEAEISEEDLVFISNNRNSFERFISGNLGDGNGNVKLDKDLSEEEQERLNDLLNKYSLEELEEAVKANDKEEDAKVDPLTGLIGEYAFASYLENNEKTSRIKFEYTADFVAEYDFDLGNGILVDTKTTVKSLKGPENSVPFYIKKSQYSFMMREKPENYYIARLSLEDTGLTIIRENFKHLSNMDVESMPLEDKDNLKEAINDFYSKPEQIKQFKESMMAFKLNYDDFL